MQLYTRTGDDGTTGLFGSGRVDKHHPRIEACGAVDEANSCLALAASACDQANTLHIAFTAILEELQHRLFDVGADLATPHGEKTSTKITRIQPAMIQKLEQSIDDIDIENKPMREFVLPGGTELASRLHLARSVCRRAERRIVAMMQSETVTPEVILFMNRLSDLLFAMARRINRDAGIPDTPWKPADPDAS